MPSALRASAFVALNVAAVALYLDVLVAALPPLAVAGRALVVVPVTVVAAVAFAAVHPWLLRSETHAGRIAVFGAFAAGGMAAFTGFLLARTPPPEPTLLSTLGLAVVLVVAQLFYGAPLFLGLLVLNKVGSPLLLARPARVWA